VLLRTIGYSVDAALNFGVSHRGEYRARIEAGIRAGGACGDGVS
jgi:hypothetical protein